MYMSLKRDNKEKEGSAYLFWGLLAAELFMSFSFLGYIHIEPISLTFVYIPVLAAGCILGIKESTLVGMVFGLASLWKASAFYVGAGDMIFSPMMSGKPISSILLSVGSRTLFGFAIGVLYYFAKKGKYSLIKVMAVTSLGRPLHSFLVYAFMGGLFPEAGFGISNTLDDTMRWDFFPSMLAADLIIFFCYSFRNSQYVQRLFYRIRTVDQINNFSGRYKKRMYIMILLVLLSSFSVTMYFTNRLSSVISRHGIELSYVVSYDIMHLQIQFLFGMISLAMIVIIVIILHLKNLNYLYYEARLDGLTGLWGRQQFFQVGEQVLDTMEFEESKSYGCFIILDIDHFKEINDRLGHPEGDKVLKAVADNLGKVFQGKGILARFGGDEFVVLVYTPMSRRDIEEHLERLKSRIDAIPIREGKVTCSIGVIPVEKNCTIDGLYRSADRLLYEAKKKGRDQSVFG